MQRAMPLQFCRQKMSAKAVRPARRQLTGQVHGGLGSRFLFLLECPCCSIRAVSNHTTKLPVTSAVFKEQKPTCRPTPEEHYKTKLTQSAAKYEQSYLAMQMPQLPGLGRKQGCIQPPASRCLMKSSPGPPYAGFLQVEIGDYFTLCREKRIGRKCCANGCMRTVPSRLPEKS